MRGYLGGLVLTHGASRPPRSVSRIRLDTRQKAQTPRGATYLDQHGCSVLPPYWSVDASPGWSTLKVATVRVRSGSTTALLRGAGSDRVEGTTVDDETFEPPNEGTWELDTTHNSRPITWFTRSALVSGFPRGFAEGLARYGLLLGRYDVAVIGGFMYAQRLPYGFGGTATPEQMRARNATSARAFTERFWREDLAHWDEVVKPEAVAAHLTVQAVDPTELSDEELAAHVGRCRDHLEAMIELHHRYSAPSLMATGDFLAGALEWTGATAGELMGLLRGTSAISAGFATAELDALADAAVASESARAVLTSRDDPVAVLDALTADPDAGPAAQAYLDAVRYRSIGYDVGEPSAGELPAMVVGAIRAAVAHRKSGPGDDGDAALTAIRARVPVEHLAEFDDRLHEARLVNRLRDERANYSDGWAVGLARRALLETGRRLAELGALADPEHAVDADATELASLVRGEAGPSRDEVAARVRRRSDADRRRRATTYRAGAVATPAAGGGAGAGPARRARDGRRDGQPVRSPRHPQLRDGAPRARGQQRRLRGAGAARRGRHRLRPRAARGRSGHAHDVALLHRRPAVARRDRHRPGRPAQPRSDRGARVRHPRRRGHPRGHPAHPGRCPCTGGRDDRRGAVGAVRSAWAH